MFLSPRSIFSALKTLSVHYKALRNVLMIILLTSKPQIEFILCIHKGAYTAIMLICLFQRATSLLHLTVVYKHMTELRHLVTVPEWEGGAVSSGEAAWHSISSYSRMCGGDVWFVLKQKFIVGLTFDSILHPHLLTVSLYKTTQFYIYKGRGSLMKDAI